MSADNVVPPNPVWKRPVRLYEGDLVALVSPASPASDGHVERAQARLESWGLRVWTGPAAGVSTDYLAGTDSQRVADLNQAIRNREIRAIFGIRGGYGCARLLPAIDFEALSKAPKILAGFSDWTALLNAVAAKCNLATLHAPTMSWLLGTEEIVEGQSKDEWSGSQMYRQLFASHPLGALERAWQWNEPWILRKGRCCGRLIGGNLTVFSSLVGTEYLPDPRGKILFLEDVGEPLYRLDRCLTQLRLAGYLEGLHGIVLGHFTTSHDEDTPHEREAFERLIARCTVGLSVPIMGNLPVGHAHPSGSLPIGGWVEIDTNLNEMVLSEAFAVDRVTSL